MITILFNSFAFFFFSVTVIFLIIIIRQRSYQHTILLLASYFFYWYSSDYLFILLVFSTLLDFYCGKAIYNTEDKKKRKFYLILSLVGNLGLLGVFKYTDFSIESINYIASLFNVHLGLKTLNIVLPIGISFFTFQTMSYSLDIYFKKLEPTSSLLKFGLFVSFFPQLVAGPIVRARDFIPQLEKKIRLLSGNFKAGLTLIGWGLVKKVVFADNIAVFVNHFFMNPTQYPSSIPIFIGTLAFGIQIYCDFSGYSDIAIGMARIFGFKLRINFDKPYFATNITKFWNKWHISLSHWLRDYLYMPLAFRFVRKGRIGIYISIMITMILGGLWHGAAWNFLFWGFYHGILLSIHKFSASIRLTKIFNIFGLYRKYLALILTQYFVFLSFLMFRISDVNHLFYSLKKFIIFDFSQGLTVFLEMWKIYSIPFIFLGLFLLLHIYTFFNRDILDRIVRQDLFYWSLYLFVICLSLYFLSPTKTIEFIYFQF